MFDTIEKIEGALVHHGQTNNRAYLIKTDHNDWNLHIQTLKELAVENDYDKIVGVLPEEAKEDFVSQGYHLEAKIPGLYNGGKTGYFLSNFLNDDRSNCDEKKKKIIKSVKTIALAATNSSRDPYLVTSDGFEIRKLTTEDAQVLSKFNGKVVKQYAFPIYEEDFVLECMMNGYEFYGLFENGELIVAANLKINKLEFYAEIVDFVTLPKYRGQNLSYYLVQKIKEDLSKQNFKTLFSLVRATSYGLNITLRAHGFLLGGTLVNNTLIKNSMESMNVWYLSL